MHNKSKYYSYYKINKGPTCIYFIYILFMTDKNFEIARDIAKIIEISLSFNIFRTYYLHRISINNFLKL